MATVVPANEVLDLSQNREADFQANGKPVPARQEILSHSAHFVGQTNGTVQHVCEMLSELGQDAELCSTFASQEIDLETLVKLDNADYAALGVMLGPREKIKLAAQNAHVGAFVASPFTNYSTVPFRPSQVTDAEKRERCFAPNEIEEDVLWVDVSVEVIHLSSASTANGTAQLQMQLVYYWTDVRFLDWPKHKLVLPLNTWGPECRLKDDRELSHPVDITFCVYNRAKARMKRCVKYNILVNWKLSVQRLLDFPFDVQDLTVFFRSSSDYRSSAPHDYTGSSADRHHYRLREARRSETCGSNFLKVGDFHDHEWSVAALSTDLTFEKSVDGYEPANLKVHFHLVRRPFFFLNQIVFPLWVTTMLGLATYAVPIAEVQDRVAISITCLLAQFALLYISQANLPNLSRVTVVDKMIILSISITFIAGYSTVAVYWLYTENEGAQSQWWDSTDHSTMNAYLLFSTLLLYHSILLYVLYTSGCPYISMGAHFAKIQDMVNDRVDEAITDITCHPSLIEQLETKAETAAVSSQNSGQELMCADNGGYKNALYLISGVAMQCVYRGGAQRFKYRTNKEQPTRATGSLSPVAKLGATETCTNLTDSQLLEN